MSEGETFLWGVCRAQLPPIFLADVSVGGSQGAAIANFLADVSVGLLRGAATANFLAGGCVGHLQGAAIAFFSFKS